MGYKSRQFEGGRDAVGWRSRVARWFGRDGAATSRKPRLVKVWDQRRGTYRSVDLDDRTDPLWDAARTLAACSRPSRGRSAA